MLHKYGLDTNSMTYYDGNKITQFIDWLQNILQLIKEMETMGIIVCQQCDCTIDHFEDEKVSTLYAKCDGCNDHHHEETNEQY